MSDNGVEILLVEDNPHDVELACYAFKKHNLTNSVRVLRDGLEAMDYLRECARSGIECLPKVILLDLKLPRKSGLEVLEEIKADEMLGRVPVVVLTSSHEESDLIRSYDLGVASYIVKPVDFEQFVDAVRELGYYWLLLNKAPAHGAPGGGR